MHEKSSSFPHFDILHDHGDSQPAVVLLDFCHFRNHSGTEKKIVTVKGLVSLYKLCVCLFCV